jgi:hypothetical protein
MDTYQPQYLWIAVLECNFRISHQLLVRPLARSAVQKIAGMMVITEQFAMVQKIRYGFVMMADGQVMVTA